MMPSSVDSFSNNKKYNKEVKMLASFLAWLMVIKMVYLPSQIEVSSVLDCGFTFINRNNIVY